MQCPDKRLVFLHLSRTYSIKFLFSFSHSFSVSFPRSIKFCRTRSCCGQSTITWYSCRNTTQQKYNATQKITCAPNEKQGTLYNQQLGRDVRILRKKNWNSAHVTSKFCKSFSWILHKFWHFSDFPLLKLLVALLYDPVCHTIILA